MKMLIQTRSTAVRALKMPHRRAVLHVLAVQVWNVQMAKVVMDTHRAMTERAFIAVRVGRTLHRNA
jgi:hypothetical protein